MSPNHRVSRRPSPQLSSRLPVPRSHLVVSVVLIVVLGFVAYVNSLQGAFIWDDEALVTANAYVRGPEGIRGILTRHLSAGIGQTSHFFRPVQMLTYFVDYQIWQLRPFGYHLTNLLLHIGCGIVLFAGLVSVSAEIRFSLMAALLFLLHPIQTESVAYISGRADPLAAFFLLMAFWFYSRIVAGRAAFWISCCAFVYGLALFAKESSLVFPLILLVYHVTLKKKIHKPALAVVTVVSGLYVLLRLTVLKGLIATQENPSTWLERLPGFFAALASYLRLMVAPVGLHMEYGNRIFSWSEPRVIAGVVILAVGIWAVRSSVKSGQKVLAFGLLWFMTALMPVANIYPVNAYMAEHWLYLPSVGLCIVGAHGLDMIYRRKKEIGQAALVLLLGMGLVLTVRQNTYWRDPVVFYERTMAYSPDSPRVVYNLGMLYKSQGRVDEAAELYRQALILNPKFTSAYNNLANIYQAQGLWSEAEDLYLEALKLEPDSPLFLNNLGNLYQAVGRRRQAIDLYEKAISVKPDYWDAYSNLALALAGEGRDEEAEIVLKKVIAMNPGYPMAYRSLAIIYYQTGRWSLSVEYHDRARQLGDEGNPKFSGQIDLLRRDTARI